jgi:DNA-binding transcriptional LysR family regulator
MRNATLRQLKIFETVGRRLSFSRAAEELHLTQPAVSAQIRQLEGHAGGALFEQLGKKIYLTQTGVEMLHHSRAIIQQFREAEDAMARIKGVSGGRLNVAVISAGDYFFPRLLMEFKRQQPNFAINLSVHNRDGLLQQLSDNSTDLAIMVRPPLGADMVVEPFAAHPYLIVAAPDHPLVGVANLPLARLTKEPMIVRERGSDTWNSMAEAFGKRLLRQNIAMEIGSTETIKQSVIAGMGIAFVSAHTINLELRVGSLAVLDVQGFPSMRHWHVVHRENKRLPAVALEFKRFLLRDGASAIDRMMQIAPESRAPGAPATALASTVARAPRGALRRRAQPFVADRH